MERPSRRARGDLTDLELPDIKSFVCDHFEPTYVHGTATGFVNSTTADMLSLT